MSLPGSIGLLSRVPSPASSIYGNVDGPASATNNAIALFDGTTGKLIKNSAYIMAGAGGTITVSGNATLNQDVSTAGSPSFAGLTLTGALAAGSNSITGGAGSFTTLSATSYVTGAGTNPGGLGGARWVYDWFAGNHRQFSYGVDASTNGAWTWISQRSDGTNSVTPMSLTSTGLAVTGTLSTTSTLTTLGGATFHTTSSALTNGAGAGAGTLTNAPAAGNPTKWIGINDNGTTRYIPAW